MSASRKVTPESLAKAVLLDCMENAYYWTERFEDLAEAMTQKQRDEVSRLVDKNFRRVIGYLKTEDHWKTISEARTERLVA